MPAIFIPHNNSSHKVNKRNKYLKKKHKRIRVTKRRKKKTKENVARMEETTYLI